jgi:serine/threonine-protein kinase
MEQTVGEQYQDPVLFYESQNSRIYKARDIDNELDVILKCFPPERQDAFLREMSAAFGIEHPNINNCLDTLYLEAENRSCMVYEFIPGGSLRGYLQEHGALPSEEVFQCLKDILKALEYVHHKGFIHCDLKPENILLREQASGEIQYILADLGAAASIREAHEGTHTMSSPAYAAPERLYDRFTPSSDLYSLGVIGFELATGQRPFSGNTTQIARAHLNDTADFARISHPYLREFIARLMDKEPIQRSTAENALHSLTQFENGYSAEFNTQETTPTLHQVKQSRPTLRGVRLTTQAPCSQTELDYRLDKLLMFQINDEPLVGLGYDNNLSLFAALDKAPRYLLANADPVKPQSEHSLLYASRGKLYCLDLKNRKHLCIYDTEANINAFDARGEYIVWSTTESVHSYNRHSNEGASYRNSNYLMRPVLCALEEGCFACSEDYMNQTLVLRDAKMQKQQAWELDGPIVMCQQLADVLLVVTMGMQDNSRYSLWRLGLNIESRQIELPDALVQYCSTPSQFFWVTALGELYACGPSLIPKLIGKLPLERIDLLHVSLDHHYISAASHHGGYSRLQIWENGGHDLINF